MDSSPQSGGAASRLEVTTAIVSLALFAAALTCLGWAAMPPHRKSQIHLGLLRLWRRVLSQHAHHIAVRSMARELATGQQDYADSYAMALRVDRVDARINMVRRGLEP